MRIARALAASAALVAAACGGDSTTTPDPPALDTSTMEPLVREMLETRRAAVVARPDDARAWADLGFAFDAHFFLEEAETTLGVAVELDPTYFEAAYDHAVVGTFLPRDAAEIAERFRGANALRPDYAPGVARLGNHLLTNGDSAGAEASFRAALDVYAEYDYAKLGLARALLDQDDVAGALALLAPLHERYPGDQGVATAYGQALTFDGRVDEARAVTERQASAAPSKVSLQDSLRREIMGISRSAAMNFQRGEAKLRKGDLAGAAIEFERVLTVDADNRRARLMLADTLIKLRRLPEARGALAAALERDDDDPSAHALLGQLDVEADADESGCAHLEIAARGATLDPLSFRAWTTGLGRLQRWDEVVFRVDEWVAAHPTHPDPPYILALAHFNAGRLPEARAALAEAIAAHPQNPLRPQIELAIGR